MKKQEQRRIFSRQRAMLSPQLTPEQLKGVIGGLNGTISWCDPHGRDDGDAF